MYVSVTINQPGKPNTTRNVLVESWDFSQCIKGAEANLREGEQISFAQLTTTAMDIKASIAEYCYIFSFIDKASNVTDNYYMFTNDFKQVSEFINSQRARGLFLNALVSKQSEFISVM